MITFKRSSHTKRWCAFGPAAEMPVGQVVEVHRVDGSTCLKKVSKISKTFDVDVDGVPVAHAFGTVHGDICPECRHSEIPREDGATMCTGCAYEDLGLLR